MTLTLVLGAIALVWLLKMIAAAMDEKGALLLAGWVLIAIVALAAFLAGGDGSFALYAALAWGVVVAFVSLEPKPRAARSAAEKEEKRALPRLIKERIAQVGFALDDPVLRRLWSRSAELEVKQSPTPEALASLAGNEALEAVFERQSRPQ